MNMNEILKLIFGRVETNVAFSPFPTMFSKVLLYRVVKIRYLDCLKVEYINKQFECLPICRALSGRNTYGVK